MAVSIILMISKTTRPIDLKFNIDIQLHLRKVRTDMKNPLDVFLGHQVETTACKYFNVYFIIIMFLWKLSVYKPIRAKYKYKNEKMA